MLQVVEFCMHSNVSAGAFGAPLSIRHHTMAVGGISAVAHVVVGCFTGSASQLERCHKQKDGNVSVHLYCRLFVVMDFCRCQAFLITQGAFISTQT